MRTTDKELTAILMKRGLSWDQAREAVGVILEERQKADREGYERGYNTGYTNAAEIRHRR